MNDAIRCGAAQRRAWPWIFLPASMILVLAAGCGGGDGGADLQASADKPSGETNAEQPPDPTPARPTPKASPPYRNPLRDRSL